MSTRIPTSIFQTWKTSDVAAWSRSMRGWVKSWQELNAEHVHRLFDDSACFEHIAERFPHLLDVYCGLRPVERADLWRYLVVLERGGIYSDVDTVCRLPIETWLVNDDELVVALEWDLLDRYPEWRPRKRLRSGGAYDPSCAWRDHPVMIANWTFAARAGHPVLRDVVERVATNARDPYFVLEDPAWTTKKTGPGVLTDAIVDYLQARGTSLVEVAYSLRVVSEVRVGGVRILNRHAFRREHVLHVGMSSWNPDARAPWTRIATGVRTALSWF